MRRLGLLALALCVGGAAACRREAKPDAGARSAPALEIVALDDALEDPFPSADKALPRGASFHIEIVPRRAASEQEPPVLLTRFVRIVCAPGESMDAALERARPWSAGFSLPKDDRLVFGAIWETDERDKPQIVGFRSYVAKGSPLFTRSDVAAVDVAPGDGKSPTSKPAVRLKLSPAAKERWHGFIEAQSTPRVAVLLDGKVLLAPIVMRDEGAEAGAARAAVGIDSRVESAPSILEEREGVAIRTALDEGDANVQRADAERLAATLRGDAAR